MRRDTVERECAEEEEIVGSQTHNDCEWDTTHENDEQLFLKLAPYASQSVLEPNARKCCLCKVRAVRCSVCTFSLFTRLLTEALHLLPPVSAKPCQDPHRALQEATRIQSIRGRRHISVAFERVKLPMNLPSVKVMLLGSRLGSLTRRVPRFKQHPPCVDAKIG